MNVLLVTSYWPNLHYFFYVLNASIINIEQFDNYSKQSYRNRTQILSANGILNLSIPIKKNKSKKVVKSIEISYKEDWQKNHWRAITSAYKNSPYFDFFEEDLKVFYSNKYNLLEGKKELSMYEAIDKYYHNYKPKNLLMRENLKKKEKLFFSVIVFALISIIYFLYKK